MRPIKFRAWDGETMFTEDDYGEIVFTGENEFFVLGKDDTGTTPSEAKERIYLCSNNPNFDEGILLQYTGLKDKKGVEIYEGDVLHNTDMQKQIDNDDDVKKKWRALEIVVWENGCFTTDVGHDDVFIPNKYCVVIGNIYQNPELVKEIEDFERKEIH